MLTKYLYSIMLLLAILLTHNSSSKAQTNHGTSFYGDHDDLHNICDDFKAYEQEETVVIVDNMLLKIGIPKRNFKVAECPNITGCQALKRRGVPYIIYNKNFLKEFKGMSFSQRKLPAKTNWAALTVLAHEIAHILLQHLDNPIVESQHQQKLELQADDYAGYIMYKMGATLEQAQKAMYHPDVKEEVEDYHTHPARKDRLAAIKSGWDRAMQENTRRKNNTKNRDKKAAKGPCYESVTIPRKYKTVEETYLVEPEKVIQHVIPAEYGTVNEQVLVKEGYNVLVVSAPSFSTISDQILMKDAGSRLDYVPPVYETVTEVINGRSISKQVLKASGTTRETPVPAEYKTITKAVVQSPAQVMEKTVPAEYRTVTKQALVTPRKVEKEVIPAKYETIKRQVVVEETTKMVEVPCDD